MRLFPTVFLVGLIMSTTLARAADDLDATEVMAKRGKGVVTQDDIYARIDRIPEGSRFAAVRDRTRLRDVINTLLLRAQLAADAREAGFDQEQVVADRMRLAAETELAEAWVQHYVDMQPEGDYEALALEYYQLHQDQSPRGAS